MCAAVSCTVCGHARQCSRAGTASSPICVLSSRASASGPGLCHQGAAGLHERAHSPVDRLSALGVHAIVPRPLAHLGAPGCTGQPRDLPLLLGHPTSRSCCTCPRPHANPGWKRAHNIALGAWSYCPRRSRRSSATSASNSRACWAMVASTRRRYPGHHRKPLATRVCLPIQFVVGSILA